MRLVKIKTPFSLVLGMVGAGLISLSSANAQLLLQLKASNYNTTSGIWSGSGGTTINATQTAGSANQATLVTGATANGSSVVRFDGSNDFFNLSSNIATSGGNYTVFAFIKIASATGVKTILGGGTNTLQYRVNGQKEEVLKQGVIGAGTGTTNLLTTSFSSINVTVGATAGTLRLNGSADGNTTAQTFGSQITRIGTRTEGGEYFNGDIAEIRLYSGVLDLAARQAVEAEFNASYVAVPEPHEYALVMSGLLFVVIMVRRNRLARSA